MLVVLRRLGNDSLYALDVVALRLVADRRQVALEVVDLCQPLVDGRLLVRRWLQLAQVRDRMVEDRERLVRDVCEIREALGIRQRLRLLRVLGADGVGLRCVFVTR